MGLGIINAAASLISICTINIFLSKRSRKRLVHIVPSKFSYLVQKADDSATRINRLHEVIKGEDPVTGGYYDALDHEQLLWVHACLQISSIYF